MILITEETRAGWCVVGARGRIRDLLRADGIAEKTEALAEP